MTHYQYLVNTNRTIHNTQGRSNNYTNYLTLIRHTKASTDPPTYYIYRNPMPSGVNHTYKEPNAFRQW